MFKSATQPFCRFCGKPIPKDTVLVWVVAKRSEYNKDHGSIRYAVSPQPLKTKADVQKLTNAVVLSVSYSCDVAPFGSDPDPSTRHITKFTEWDGESYRHQHFCNNTVCAVRFAKMLADQTTLATSAYFEATGKPYEKAKSKTVAT